MSYLRQTITKAECHTYLLNFNRCNDKFSPALYHTAHDHSNVNLSKAELSNNKKTLINQCSKPQSGLQFSSEKLYSIVSHVGALSIYFVPRLIHKCCNPILIWIKVHRRSMQQCTSCNSNMIQLQMFTMMNVNLIHREREAPILKWACKNKENIYSRFESILVFFQRSDPQRQGKGGEMPFSTIQERTCLADEEAETTVNWNQKGGLSAVAADAVCHRLMIYAEQDKQRNSQSDRLPGLLNTITAWSEWRQRISRT